MMRDLANLPPPPLVDRFAPVDRDELARLLRMPGSGAFDEDMRKSITAVEDWHEANVSIWHHRQIHGIETMAGDHLILAGGNRLPIGGSFRNKLARSGARAVILLAYTVGGETDRHAARLWAEDRLDESYLVKMYGATLAEGLRTRYMLALCDWAAALDLSLLPPEGPGYNDWPAGQLADLYNLIAAGAGPVLSGHIALHPPGALEPANSMLLAFGLTSYSGLDKIRRRELFPCSDCTFHPCDYRRAAYRPV